MYQVGSWKPDSENRSLLTFNPGSVIFKHLLHNGDKNNKKKNETVPFLLRTRTTETLCNMLLNMFLFLQTGTMYYNYNCKQNVTYYYTYLIPQYNNFNTQFVLIKSEHAFSSGFRVKVECFKTLATFEIVIASINYFESGSKEDVIAEAQLDFFIRCP